MKVKAAADFLPLVAEIDALGRRHEPAASADPGPAAAAAWHEITSGGWLGIGLEVGPLELAEAARAWGRYLIPAPFLTSVLAYRWRESADQVAEGQATTCAIATSRGPMAPFAAWPEIQIWSQGKAGDEDGAGISDAQPASAGDTTDEDFAPSLALGRCDAASLLDSRASQELAALWAAEAIGGAEQVLRRSVQYAKQREAYGHLIGSYQAVAHLLAEMHRDAEFGWSGVVWAAQCDGDAIQAAQAAIKLATSVIQGGIQVHGGIGFTWELGLHRYLRHSIAVAELVRGLAATTAPDAALGSPGDPGGAR
jgi:hypothetical protein